MKLFAVSSFSLLVGLPLLSFVLDSMSVASNESVGRLLFNSLLISQCSSELFLDSIVSHCVSHSKVSKPFVSLRILVNSSITWSNNLFNWIGVALVLLSVWVSSYSFVYFLVGIFTGFYIHL